MKKAPVNPFEAAKFVVFTDFSDWLGARRSAITGTDAYKLIMGKFGELFDEKTTKRYSPQTMQMKIGLALESVLSEYASKDLGRFINRQRNALFYSKNIPGIAGSLDGWTDDGEIVEFKCSMTKGFWPEESIPDNYYCQVQHYMLVTGAKVAYLYALLLTGEDVTPRKYVIEREDTICDELLNRITVFLRALESGVRPEDQEPYQFYKVVDGKAERSKPVLTVKSFDPPVKATDEVAKLMQEYAEAAKAAKEAMERREEISRQLKELLDKPMISPFDGSIWRVDVMSTPIYSIPIYLKEQYRTGEKQYKKLTITQRRETDENKAERYGSTHYAQDHSVPW